MLKMVTPQKTKMPQKMIDLEVKKIIDVKVAVAQHAIERCEITGKVQLPSGDAQRIHVKTFHKKSYGPLYEQAGRKLAELVQQGKLSKRDALARIHGLPGSRG